MHLQIFHQRWACHHVGLATHTKSLWQGDVGHHLVWCITPTCCIYINGVDFRLSTDILLDHYTHISPTSIFLSFSSYQYLNPQENCKNDRDQSIHCSGMVHNSGLLLMHTNSGIVYHQAVLHTNVQYRAPQDHRAHIWVFCVPHDTSKHSAPSQNHCKGNSDVMDPCKCISHNIFEG